MLSTWANLNDMLEKYSVPEEEEDKQPWKIDLFFKTITEGKI
jgi:hypothetical protein